MLELLAVGLLTTTFAGIGYAKAEGQRRLSKSLVALKLQFPRELTADDAISVMAGWSQLLLPAWKRPFSSPFVVLETHASATGIDHYLLVPEVWLGTAQNLLQASVPSVRYIQVDLPEVSVRSAAEYRLTSNQRPLRVEVEALSVKLLSNLQPLDDNESVVVQWIVTPHPAVTPPKVNRHSDPAFRAVSMDSESVAALRKKQSRPLLLTAGRIGVRGPTLWREYKRLREVEGSWHETRAPGVHFTRRLLPERVVASSLRRRTSPTITWPSTLTDEELTSLSGWPVGVSAVPGLSLGGCRLIPPSPLIPRTGNVIAESTFPGERRPLAMDDDALSRPTLILGPTGVGKSTLMAELIVQDLEAGRSVIAVDPKGDLISHQILNHIPAHRQRDIVVLDPEDERCPGLNPFYGRGVDPEVLVSNFVGSLRALHSGSWGPRLENILVGAATTLSRIEGSTVADLIRVLTDGGYRRKLVGQLDDPLGTEPFWDWFENGMSDAERQTAIAPVINKLTPLTLQPRLRKIFGQSRPALDIGEIMASGKVLLCSLSEASLGTSESQLLGAMLMASIWSAITARARLPEDRRPIVRAYFDELSTLVTLPTPIGALLAMSRGMGVGQCVATQHLHQMDSETRAAVLANCTTKICFQLTAADARIMEREMAGILTSDDLQGLGAHEVVCQIFAAGSTQSAATGITSPQGAPTSDAEAIRALSGELFGLTQAEVDAQILKRHGGDTSTPIRRRPRPRKVTP